MSLYTGVVRHTRLEPFRHEFRYRVFYLLLDIDQLHKLSQRLGLFSVGRFNLFGFDPKDHGPADGSSLRTWAEELLGEAGVDLEGGSIRLLAFPRILGYAFNPISEWYCYGPSGDLRGVIHEVRNTFGDRHSYVVPIGSIGLRHSADKMMHVSPFNDMNYTYAFSITQPGERLSVAIEQQDESGAMFRAGMHLTRFALTDRNLLKVFLTHPLLTAKVMFSIHWQALRLWIKGATYHPRPAERVAAHSVVQVSPEAVR